MQKKFYLLFITAILMSLTACPGNTDKTIPALKSFYGSWASQEGDWFKLSSDNVFTCYNNGDETTDWVPVPNDVAYKGTVVSADVSGDYTFANIKIINPSRSPWGLAVGEYARVALQSVDSKQCKMATGSVGEYPNNSMTASTLSELKTKFSFEAGAFTYFGDYTKK